MYRAINQGKLSDDSFVKACKEPIFGPGNRAKVEDLK